MGPGPPEFQRTFPLRKPIAGDDRRVSWNFLFILIKLFSFLMYLLLTFFSFSSFFLFLSYFLNIVFLGRFLETAHCMFTLQRYNIDNTKQIFLGKELRGYSPSSYIHVSLSYLYIPLIGLPFLLQENIGGSNMGICRSLTHTWMWKLGLRPRNFFFGNI